MHAVQSYLLFWCTPGKCSESTGCSWFWEGLISFSLRKHTWSQHIGSKPFFTRIRPSWWNAMVFWSQHHCRCCGHIYCHYCSSKSRPLLCLAYLEPVRLCDKCHEICSTKGKYNFPSRWLDDYAPSWNFWDANIATSWYMSDFSFSMCLSRRFHGSGAEWGLESCAADAR